MKTAIIGTWAALLLAVTTSADWLPEVNLTNDPHYDRQTSWNNAWCVTADTAGRVYVVWEDERDNGVYPEIYYDMKDSSGWLGNIRLTFADQSSWYPSISADTVGNIHLVWEDARHSGWPAVYYNVKTESGWAGDMWLSADSSARYPSIAAVDSENVHVVWQDYRDGNWEVYYKTKDSTGWQPDERLTVDTVFSVLPSVAIGQSGSIHVVWRNQVAGTVSVYYKVKEGGTWSADTCLSGGNGTAYNPSIATDPYDNVHVVWDDARSGNADIYYKEKSGSVWSTDTNLTQNSALSWNASVASDPFGNIHVVWMDSRDGIWRIYYKMKDTLGVWSIDYPVSASFYPWDGFAENASLACDRYGNVHVVWTVNYIDSFNSGDDIYYRMKEGPYGVEEMVNDQLPMTNFQLLQNHPNPFSEVTSIRFRVPGSSQTTLKVHDVNGRLVRTLLDNEPITNLRFPISVSWDGRNEEGTKLASGVYFYTLQAGDHSETGKAVLLR